jgi:hypothetical protein
LSGFSCGPFAASLAIAPVLLAALLPPMVAGAILAAGLDAAPPPGGCGTVVTAIATLRVGRDKPAFTTFEQAAARTPTPMGLWTWGRRKMK